MQFQFLRRFGQRCLFVLVLLLANTNFALAKPQAPLPSVIVMDIEIEGDLSDQTQLKNWERRNRKLAQYLRHELSAQGLYRVLPMEPAKELLEKFSGRHSVHACGPCLEEIAELLKGDRVLSAWVFRMSHLVLTLHVEIFDTKTKKRVFYRMLNFRGDNDRAWMHAARYLIRDLKKRAKASKSRDAKVNAPRG